MEKIKEKLNEKDLKKIREGLIVLLDGTLDIIEETANLEETANSNSEEVYKYNINYYSFFNLAKPFLSEEELKMIENRYNLLQKLWIPQQK